MKLRCDPEPLTQGWTSSLELRVENDGAAVLVLDRARWEGEGVRGEHGWGRSAEGALRYEAGADRWVLETAVSVAAPLPLRTGVLLPGSSVECYLPIQALSVASAAPVTLRVSGWRLPTDEFAARVYQAEETPAPQPVQRFFPGPPPAGPVRDALVRVSGLEPLEATLELGLAVEPCPRDPAPAGPGGLVGRVRRLGGAWVFAGPEGALHLARGGTWLRCPPGCLDLATLQALDRDPPFLPVDLVFRGPAARALRDGAELPLSGRELGQQRLEATELWRLLELAPQAGVGLRWGRHAPLAWGVVVADLGGPG